jgi:hypothetical protein
MAAIGWMASQIWRRSASPLGESPGPSRMRGAPGKAQEGGNRRVPHNARKTTEAFWPPNPRLLLRTVRTFTARAAFGT